MKILRFFSLIIVILLICYLPSRAIDIEYVGTLELDSLIDSSKAFDQVSSIYKEKNTIYILSQNNGLVAVEWLENTEPKLKGGYYSDFNLNGLAVKENHVYVSFGEFTLYNDYEKNGILNIDLSVPEYPHEITRYKTSRPAGLMYLADDYLFMGVDYHSMHIFDCSDSNDFKLISKIPVMANFVDICAIDTLVYLLCSDYGLQVYSIADLQKPIFLGSYTLSAESMKIRDNFAFIASWEDDLLIYDITIPDRIKLVGEYHIEEEVDQKYKLYFREIELYENFAFIIQAFAECKLLLLDVKVVSNPILVKCISLDGLIDKLYISENDLFLYGDNRIIWMKIIE